MRISDWSSDVCSSDLLHRLRRRARRFLRQHVAEQRIEAQRVEAGREMVGDRRRNIERAAVGMVDAQPAAVQMQLVADRAGQRSEEHTSELQSLMRISYAVFCLKKKKDKQHSHTYTITTTT